MSSPYMVIFYHKKLYNDGIILPKICRNRQGQTDRDHEVWTPKDVAQGQGFDCQAKVNFEIIYPERILSKVIVSYLNHLKNMTTT